jgi:flagellar protein FlbD
MIVVHRLNGTEFVLNDNHIETIEETPDSVITLTNDRKYIVTESAEEIIRMIIEYHKKIEKKLLKKG